MRPVLFAAIAALSLGTSQLASAQAKAAHPDFTGTWVLDTARTAKSPMVPTALSYTVKQTPAMISMDRKIESARGASSGTMNYTLDGKPTKNTLSMGGQNLEATSVVKWAADTLVLDSDISFGEQTAHQNDRWTLDAAGKVVTIDRNIDAGNGQVMTMQYVLKRQ